MHFEINADVLINIDKFPVEIENAESMTEKELNKEIKKAMFVKLDKFLTILDIKGVDSGDNGYAEALTINKLEKVEI